MAVGMTLTLPNSPSGTFDNSVSFQNNSISNTGGLPAYGAPKFIFGASGAGKINLWSKVYEGTLTGTVDFDLTSLLDPAGNAINFARVKGILVINFATTAGFVLKMGLGTNPLVAMYDAVATAKLVIGAGYVSSTNVNVPNYVYLPYPDTNGLVVDSTHKVIRLDSGANAIPYLFHVVGNDA